MFVKPKKHLRFLIKISFDDKEAVLTKVSPILNQLSIDDTANIDDVLFSFFTHNYHPFFDNKKITAKVYFTIWKNRNLYNSIKIKPMLFYEYILKFKKRAHEFSWLTFYNYGPFLFSGVRGRGDLLFRSYGLSISLIESTTWTLISGYQFFFNKMWPALNLYRGVAHSYLHRDKMLGRKINFRRKAQKQKFEDY